MNTTGVPVCSCRWVHVGCAVAMPEVFFQNVNHREGINTNSISPARRKLVSNIATLFLSFVPAILMTYTLLFVYRSVSSVDQVRQPAEGTMAHACSVAQESARFLST